MRVLQTFRAVAGAPFGVTRLAGCADRARQEALREAPLGALLNRMRRDAAHERAEERTEHKADCAAGAAFGAALASGAHELCGAMRAVPKGRRLAWAADHFRAIGPAQSAEIVATTERHTQLLLAAFQAAWGAPE